MSYYELCSQGYKYLASRRETSTPNLQAKLATTSKSKPKAIRLFVDPKEAMDDSREAPRTTMDKIKIVDGPKGSDGQQQGGTLRKICEPRSLHVGLRRRGRFQITFDHAQHLMKPSIIFSNMSIDSFCFVSCSIC
mmetsp:Transcript_32363/g.48053  ORF Transcript_32363/g.48053 Transcript_32363/m.48053 type:complete len:135 (-) Transcript_32363:178-582(-)